MIAKKKESNDLIVFVIVIVGFFLLSNQPAKQELDIITGQWDISSEVGDKGYDIYLVEELDFDYSNPAVYAKAQEIKQSTTSAKDAISKTIKFVAKNTKYSSKITVNYCYNEKASLVLSSGVGDCVSMSRLVTSLLRAQGIPARTSGGCLSAFKRCIPLFATIPYWEAKTTPMEAEDFKKRGYLHEWVEAWEPTEGWQIIEATSGQAFPLVCNAYMQFAYDDNQYNRCVIMDQNFWNSCKRY